MSKLTIVLHAAILFAVVTKATIASPTECTKTKARGHVAFLTRLFNDKDRAITNAIEETFGLDNEVQILLVDLEINIGQTIRESGDEIEEIFTGANSTFNETKCISYYNELDKKRGIPKQNSTSHIECTLKEREQRLLEAVSATKEALTELSHIERSAESCHGNRCCDVMKSANTAKNKFFSRVNGLSCTDKMPLAFANKTIASNFEEFKKWAREAVQDTYACVHNTHE